MHSTAYALTWPLWRQYRYRCVVLLLVVNVCAILAPFVPRGTGADTLLISAPLSLVFSLLVAAFTYAGLSGEKPMPCDFPSHFLTLPVTTRALVGWPMLFGTILAAVAWWVLVPLVFWPRGIEVPFVWPGVAAAALIACCQAVAWWPFPGPMTRLLATCLGLGVPFGPLLVLGVAFDAPPVLFTLAFAGLIGLGYVAAVEGVGRLRRGDVATGATLIDAVQDVGQRLFRSRRVFRSAAAAQLWMELRLGGLILPTLVALSLGGIVAVSSEPAFPWVAFGGIVLMPAYLATFIGPLVAKPEIWARGIRLSSFAATRPVPSGFFVVAKMKAAAVSALAACLLMLPAALCWLLTHPNSEVVRGLRALAADTHPLRLMSGAVMVFAAIVLVTWTQLIQLVGFQMSGRAWFGHAFMWIGMVLAYPLYFGLLWIIEHPEHHQTLLRMIPPVVGCLAILKVAAGLGVYVAVKRRRLLEAGQPQALAVLWVVVVGAGVSVTVVLIPGAGERWYRLVPVAVLLVPFVRPFLGILATDWNRHR